MRISRIAVCNFGPYRGDCAFDVSSDDPRRRIVVIGGKNGAGKTTLFTAMQVCLYGHHAFGFRLAGKRYLREIFQLINNQVKLDRKAGAYVEIRFSEQTGPDEFRYTVRREWSWEQESLQETLTVCEDGRELDAEETIRFQNYLLHLIPPDLLRLYFFDGEKMAAYFLLSRENHLKNAIMVLSGNDTFEILHDSVRRLLNRRDNPDDRPLQDYWKHQEEMDSLQRQKAALEGRLKDLELQREDTHIQSEALDQEYRQQGGISLEEWKALQASQRQEEDIRRRLNDERREIAETILPFFLVSDQLEEIESQLQREQEQAAHRMLLDTLRGEAFSHALYEAIRQLGTPHAREDSRRVLEYVSRQMEDPLSESLEPILQLSTDDQAFVRTFVRKVRQSSISRLREIDELLQSSQTKGKALKEQAENSSIDRLEDYLRQKAEFQQQEESLKRELGEAEKDLGRLTAEIREGERVLQASKKEAEAVLKKRSAASLSGRICLLVEDLQKELYDHLVRQIERDVNRKFRQLLRKEDFFEAIEIDSGFQLHLLRRQSIQKASLLELMQTHGAAALRERLHPRAYAELLEALHTDERDLPFLLQAAEAKAWDLPVEMDIAQLSNGEKQILVMALYWAIVRQGKNDLPFIIDTPFARIDTEHRANITRYFFSELPGQLFVLSTNEELGRQHLAFLEDQIAHTYLLEYGENQQTRVLKDRYFEV